MRRSGPAKPSANLEPRVRFRASVVQIAWDRTSGLRYHAGQLADALDKAAVWGLRSDRWSGSRRRAGVARRGRVATLAEMLPITDFADDGVIENADRKSRLGRQGGGQSRHS